MIYGNVGYDGEIDVNGRLVEINKSLTLRFEMMKEKEKYAKLEQLALEDYVKTIKSVVSYYHLLYGVDESNEWLKMLDKENIDKRRKYDEKTSYDYCCRMLENNITDEKTTIKKIMYYGYGRHGVEFYFTVENNNTLFSLTVPDIEKLNCENLSEMCDGKLRLGYYKNEYVNDFITSSYKEEDVKIAFKTFIEGEKFVEGK